MWFAAAQQAVAADERTTPHHEVEFCQVRSQLNARVVRPLPIVHHALADSNNACPRLGTAVEYDAEFFRGLHRPFIHEAVLMRYSTYVLLLFATATAAAPAAPLLAQDAVVWEKSAG
jgi:hypothetical protein